MEESDDDDEDDDKEEELSPPSHFRTSSGAGGGGGGGGGGDGSKHGSEPRLSSVSATMLTGAEPSDVSMALLKAEMTGGEGVSQYCAALGKITKSWSQHAPTPVLRLNYRCY